MLYLLLTLTARREKGDIMSEPFDEYVDQFAIAAGVYGISLNFQRSGPKPIAPGSMPTTEEVGTIRMSLEHFKMMAFIMKRNIDEIENQLGIEIPLPFQVLNGLKIAPEEWQKFWQRPR
jgi:hypothetical protein